MVSSSVLVAASRFVKGRLCATQQRRVLIEVSHQRLHRFRFSSQRIHAKRHFSNASPHAVSSLRLESAAEYPQADLIVAALSAKDKEAGGAHRVTRDVLHFIARSTNFDIQEVEASSWENILDIAAIRLQASLETQQKESHTGHATVTPSSTAVPIQFLVRCARQMYRAGLSRLHAPITHLFLESIMSEVLRQCDHTSVRAIAELGDLCASEGVNLGSHSHQLAACLSQGLKHEAAQGAGSQIGAGWWSAMALRINRMGSAHLLPSCEADALQLFLEEQIVSRLPTSSLQEAIQTWRRLRKLALRCRIAEAVGEFIRQYCLHSLAMASRHGVLIPEASLHRFSKSLRELARLGWHCPSRVRMSPAEEEQIVAVIYESGDAPEVLAALAEACVAVSFPSDRPSKLLAAVCDRVSVQGDGLSSRNAVDTGIRLALAGVADEHVYTAIRRAAQTRFSTGKNFNPLWIVSAAARLSLSGIGSSELFRVMVDSVRSEGFENAKLLPHELQALRDMASGSFDMFSDLPLLQLLRLNWKVPKVARTPRGLSELPGQSADWGSHGHPCAFLEPHLPLVVDLGCGRGMWLLNLLRRSNQTGFNGLGVDTVPRLLAYPRGMAKRLQLTSRLQFALCGAEDAVRGLASYPGKVVLVVLHFPTPFALTNYGGNSQLPSEEDFIAHPGLVKALANLPGATIFIQSDTLDIALHIRGMLETQKAFRTLTHAELLSRLPFTRSSPQEASAEVVNLDPETRLREARARITSALEGRTPHAPHDIDWLRWSPFPPSESEVHSRINGKQIYRFAVEVLQEFCPAKAVHDLHAYHGNSCVTPTPD